MIEKKKMQSVAARGLALLFGIMLLFTMLSRVTASFTVARVTVENPFCQALVHTVSADGIISEDQELAVVTEPDILVKTVYAAAGERVKEGDVLAELDLEHLAGQITILQEEIQMLELSNQAVLANRHRESAQRETALSRAKEDYEQMAESQKRAVDAAANDLRSAQEAYDSYQNAIGERSLSDEEYQQLVVLKEAKDAKQAAYDTAVENQQEALKNAERAVEDAADAKTADNTAEMNQIQIDQKKRSLKRLEQLAAGEGKITAPVEGIVTVCNLITGQKTADTAAYTLADISKGMRFTASVEKDAAKYVSVGDEVTLQKNKDKLEGNVIDSVMSQEDGSIEVTVIFQKTDWNIGDNVTMELRKQTSEKGLTVPITALYEDNGKAYLYVLETADTVLGEEKQAVRVDVTVQDKNGLYALVKSSVLSENSQVITDSDRFVENGGKVRLWEK